MDKLTAKQLVEFLHEKGIKCGERRIEYWVHAGLIPEPELGLTSSGKGMCGYFPEETKDRLLKIIELKKHGYKMHQIKEVLTQRKELSCPHCGVENLFEKHCALIQPSFPSESWEEIKTRVVLELDSQIFGDPTFSIECGDCGYEWSTYKSFWEDVMAQFTEDQKQVYDKLKELGEGNQDYFTPAIVGDQCGKQKSEAALWARKFLEELRAIGFVVTRNNGYRIVDIDPQAPDSEPPDTN